MYIAILGRQPALSVAELESLYGADRVAWLSDSAAKITHPGFDFERLGGSRKAGRIITEFPGLKWPLLSTKIADLYHEKWHNLDHKITLGISAYDLEVRPRDLLQLGLTLKKIAQKSGGSLRLIPSADPALSTATSHHNKLGLSPNKIELLLVKASNGRIVLAESVGAQNITAFAARDQARPKTDAFVGMLPPKLARMMVNLTGINALPLPSSQPLAAERRSLGAGPATGSAPTRGASFRGRSDNDEFTSPSNGGVVPLLDGRAAPLAVTRLASDAGGALPLISSAEGSALPAEVGTRKIVTSGPTVPEASDISGKAPNQNHSITLLDPFCGTGVILQEAALLGYRIYGTDLSEKMIDYTRTNLDWLHQRYSHIATPRLDPGDATKYTWRPPIDAIASETYLGQPFSAPPSPEKLAQVRDNCDHIISEFLKNIASQLKPDTSLCLAVPAWRDRLGNFTRLPLINQLAKLGYTRRTLTHARDDQLLYYRETQVVARELLLLTKI